MKSILCFELKRCFGSKRLYLSLLTGIVISLLHIIFGVLPLTQWLSSWQGDFFLTPHSAYGHWIGMDSSTVWPTLLYMLLPFLCAFPFSDTVSWDFSTGYVMQIFVRRKKSAYLFAKALTIFIASAFLTATILFFDFAGTALYLPLVRPEALTNLYGISNRSLMAHLFYHKPLQYTVIYIIMDALLVGAWEIIALAVSVATRNGLSCFTILPYDVLPCDALTCLLPFGFALAISLLAFCLCIFCSFVWGQVFAISCLVAVSFTEFPSPFLCYAMLIRCRAMSPAGFDERAGLLFYLIFAGIVCFIGMFLFLQLDLFPGLQRRPQ